MCNVRLINSSGKVIDKFQWPSNIVKMLSFYEALGYVVDIEDAQ